MGGWKKVPAEESIGKPYGCLTVRAIEYRVYRGLRKKAWAVCDCSCGGKYEFWLSPIRLGTSVGCANCRSKRLSSQKTTHGLRQRPEYAVWSVMRHRCQNPNDPAWANYGGRGIKCCARWQKFANFIADMGFRPSDKHTLERKHNDKGYNPGNCRWATRAEQSRNNRRCRYITHCGMRLIVTDWAVKLGVRRDVIYAQRKRHPELSDSAVLSLIEQKIAAGAFKRSGDPT